MRIDKIELNGFKSFGDRTVFNFHPGITCIVGPNGCGKSNIVDAFKWVLGEQSAKSLRGEKMEELIFNGSTTKKPKGMAEVTMVISGIIGAEQTVSEENEEKISDTASVTRRLYRSGDSEYMLNKTQCRLKDIRDLFLDTGLEVKSYSILEQDRIAEILNSKPQDRRFLIEEVAGVMKYNVRKKEALSKLESSRTNLQRINDIIIEVKKQINFLDRLAKKAERYKKLTTEMHSIELKIAKRDYQALKESYESIFAEYNVLKEEEALKRADLARIENETETTRLELLEKEKMLEQVQIKFQTLEKEIAELEKSIAVARTEHDNYKEYLIKLHQQKEEFGQKETEGLQRQYELDKAETELMSEMENQKKLLSEKADFVRSLEEELSEYEESLEEKRREIFRISDELSMLRNTQSKLQTSLDGLTHREESSLKDSEGLKRMLAEVEGALKDTETGLLDKNNNIMVLQERKGIISNEVISHKNKFEKARETLSRRKEELASNTSRIESLKELLFDDTTKELLSADQGVHILASVSDVMEVGNEYEKAIESVLSEKVNSLILSSLGDIEKAISAIKGKESGRTAFIPLTPDITADLVDIPEGVLGRSLDFVRTKEEFSAVAERLLKNVFVVKDVKTAFDLISTGCRSICVTLDGEVIEPSGAVIAGEVKGIFKRKREIRELESTTEEIRMSIDHIQSEMQSLQQLIDSSETNLKSVEAAIVEKEKEISLLKLTSENYREDKERRSRKLAYLTLEVEQIIREKESIEKTLIEKEAEIQSIDSKKSASEQHGALLQEEISLKRLHIEEFRTMVTDIRLLITSLKEKLEAAGKEKEALAR
jgi:chromosome segregation protein